MSKAVKKMKPAIEKGMGKINHGNKVKTYIPAGMAIAGPPLGPQLGQKGVNIAAFCKDFNEKTKKSHRGDPSALSNHSKP